MNPSMTSPLVESDEKSVTTRARHRRSTFGGEAARFGVSFLTPAAVCLNPVLDCVQAGDGSRHAA